MTRHLCALLLAFFFTRKFAHWHLWLMCIMLSLTRPLGVAFCLDPALLRTLARFADAAVTKHLG